MSKTVELFGYPVLAARMSDVVELCAASIGAGRPIQFGVLNAAKIVRAVDDAQLGEAIRSCDVLLADGQSVVWASRLLGQPLPERVTGIDLFLQLLDLANREHRSVYLLGATHDVITRVARIVEQQYPDLVLAGYRDGYFADAEADDIALEIQRVRPDMLFLGMTSPKKEIFLRRYHRVIRVPISHGVGGSFDILAGVTKRAPILWQRLGFEWAFRLLQEPGRMWRRYLVTNSAFIGMFLREYVRSKQRHIPRRVALAGGAS